MAAWLAAGRRAVQVRVMIDRVNGWTRRHEQPLVAAVFASVGLFLLVEGLAELA
jgi:hypothetical protein